jgi:S1-C subfamily serine protease
MPWCRRLIGRPLMNTIILTAALALMPCIALAQRAKSPADATVFVRLVGSVHVEYEDINGKQVADVDRVEIGSGSGFVVSPYGYVLTNDHVVRTSEQFKVTKGRQRATFTLSVASIDVCFRPEAAAAHSMSSPCFPASVTASDSAQDLAVLYVSGSNFPYVALGDSDAVETGLAVDALGYPFGRDVEVGKVATVQDIVPDVSITPGAISAVRTNDAGERQYLQITSSVNPGNSGGPVVNRDGFAVGVLRSRLTNAAGIGFAIAINDVKDFLESHGLDQLLPARRLRLGSVQTLEPKGIALRLPEGFTDVSPFPFHVETDARSGEIALRIDRVLSAWSSKQIEQTLIGGRTFETLSMTPREGRNSPQAAEPSLLLGSAAPIAADPGREIRMDYAVLDLDSEKLVARYVGSAEWMAFNERVLRESLGSLQGWRFSAEQLAPAENVSWSAPPAASVESIERGVPMPAGWVVGPGGPSSCAGLPQPGTVMAVSPIHDSTVVLRAAVWSGGEIIPDAAASACSSRRGFIGGASYSRRATWLGMSYVIEGAFARIGSRLVQLEVLSTDQRSTFARRLLTVWLRKAAE